MSGGIPTFENMTSRRRKDVTPGRIVKPQPIKDSSYMESMVNFIHDIGQAYSTTVPVEEKETVLWARISNFETILYPDLRGSVLDSNDDISDDFLLILGYKNGIQAWIFGENEDIHEILSVRQGPVKTACLVPPPSSASDSASDKHTIARPLLAICMAADRKQLFTTVSILSLRMQDQIHVLTFNEDVEQIEEGLDGMLVVTLKQEIQVFDTLDFRLLFKITECYQSLNMDGNPIAIAKEWLAYSPAKQISSCQSAGGMEDDGISSYAATVINAAKTLKKGLVNFSETVNWLAKTSISGEEHLSQSMRETAGQRSRNQSGSSLPELTDGVPGLVTVINVLKLCKTLKDDNWPTSPNERVINGVLPVEAIVAHFSAHELPVACMRFSPCGSLLATADKRGHAFHVFSILPHPVNPKLGAVHHLYSLFRGDTSAKVQEISFSSDCRWLSVSTLRGTSHIFPIAVYGGSATVRTHISPRVVNRSSMFHKSAGLEDMDASSIALGGNHTRMDGGNLNRGRPSRPYSHGSRFHNLTNPRLPPHPKPTVVQPLAQIGTARSQHVLHLTKIAGKTNNSNEQQQGDVIIASVFMNGKLQLSGSSNGHDNGLRRTQLSTSSKGAQCLLIFTSNGLLTEHHLDPQPLSGIARKSDDSPIELIYATRFQWPLQRLLTWNEVTLPLLRSNPLLEVDSKWRVRINTQLEMTSSTSTSSSLSAVSARSADVQANSVHDDTTNIKSNDPHKLRAASLTVCEDLPKTQQPTSRNARNHNYANRHYPGLAMPEGKLPRLNNAHSAEPLIIPMGPLDHGVVKRDKASTLHLNGHLVTGCSPQEGNETECRQPSTDSGKSNTSLTLTVYDEWLAQIEMISHEGPARRLWMGPQFCFKLRQSTDSTMLLSSSSSAMFSNRNQLATLGSPPRNCDGRDVYFNDDMDVQSLKIQPRRSDPMPTPETRPANQYESNSITIEAGSGNFDRTANMLEISTGYGSLDDRRFTSLDCEDRLREKIAEAMQDSEIVGPKTRDIRTASDSSDILEFNNGPDVILTAVDQFDFDSEHPSLDMHSRTIPRSSFPVANHFAFFSGLEGTVIAGLEDEVTKSQL